MQDTTCAHTGSSTQKQTCKGCFLKIKLLEIQTCESGNFIQHLICFSGGWWAPEPKCEISTLHIQIGCDDKKNAMYLCNNAI